jgi:hypothetical protein
VRRGRRPHKRERGDERKDNEKRGGMGEASEQRVESRGKVINSVNKE